MTDRVGGILVVLEKDMREEDVEATLAAIRQIKGVLSVRTHVSHGFDEVMAQDRCRRDIAARLRTLADDFLNNKKNP